MNLPKGITKVTWRNIEQEFEQTHYRVRKMFKGVKYDKLLGSLQEAEDYLYWIKNHSDTILYSPLVIENLKLKESIENLEKVNNKINMLKKNTSVLNDESKLNEVTKMANSYSDILKAFNLKKNGKTLEILKKYINKFDIETSHLNKNIISNPSKTNEEIFIINSPVDSQVVKKRILKQNILPYICSGKKCGNTGIWHGQSIVLQLEHKNGNNHDHRLENLCFLCPNCHSITSTWGNKKRTKVE